MKKFMYILLSLMICASFCLCGCSDDTPGKNEIYLGDATIEHAYPTESSYVFVFCYVYQNNDVYEKDRVRYNLWFDDDKNSSAGSKDANAGTNAVKYITPYTSLVSTIYIEHATDIEQYKTLTVQYYVRNKADETKIDCVLAEKTFKISDILSQATDIPYKSMFG